MITTTITTTTTTTMIIHLEHTVVYYYNNINNYDKCGFLRLCVHFDLLQRNLNKHNIVHRISFQIMI